MHFVKQKPAFLIIFLLIQAIGLNAAAFRNSSFDGVDFDSFKRPREKHSGLCSVGVSYGQATQAFDEFGDSGTLFCGRGAATFGQMAAHYPYLKKFAATKTFIENVALNPDFSFFERNDLFCAGELQLIDLSLLFSVPVGENFTASLEMPIRTVQLSPLKFVTAGGNESEFAKLVNANLPLVLAEHGVEKIYEATSLTGLSDVTASIGWSDRFANDYKNITVASVGLSLKAGVILPTSTVVGNGKNYLYSVPLGNNGNFGFRMQADGEIEFRPLLAVVGMFDSKVFMRKQEQLRVAPDNKMQGVFFQPKAFVTYDKGHEWTAGAALKVGSKKWGLFAYLGYSYNSKEITRLELADNEKSSPQIFEVYTEPETLTVATLNTAKTKQVMLADHLINSDRNLARQHAHILHLALQFSPGVNVDAADANKKTLDSPVMLRPIIEIGLHVPVMAKNYYYLLQGSGSASFGIKLNF